ncbi:[protein-PII] uridylyltransferase [Stieleria varia]|uniref:Bifunctional uridylyltransferase/uridylyl-removing enzyme n=1 Tax=Stieleria varia TaxID=2528005 RepID=A0A5C6ARU7_9BACT|nr:[protein-PII] uridylyltransferase [Stieleria varia]TWU00894.1 Bifunctional uridylyltransferase/uridylyl-removing enzyme [Stieleria varia]
MNAPSISEVSLRSRERLQKGRQRCREQHDSGSGGFQISTRLAELYDDVVSDVWQTACECHFDGVAPSGIALVATGGFGRRDVAPFSDVDLLLLVKRGSSRDAEMIGGALTRDLADAGLQVGFAMRTVGEACALSWLDPKIFSSQTESRFLAGSLQLYTKFFRSLRHGAMRRATSLVRSVIAARKEEQHKWGETNYLLRPNIKCSRGTLRDIQLIRWIGFARYGEVDLERLLLLGVLPSEDYQMLRKAYDFLLRLRNELHFRNNRAQDVLDRPTQMEIADAWGYAASEGMLPVEEFMQDFFDTTRGVRYAVSFFSDDNRSRPWIKQLGERLLSSRVGDHMLMGPTHVWVEKGHLESFAQSLPQVLRLMSLANHHCKRIGHRTWEAIREAMLNRQPVPPDAESIGAFLTLLSRPGRLAPLLRRLHELRIIEQLIPAFKRTRGLLQFNAYHKYTVDAHCIRAVEAATDLQDEPTAMGRRYRRLKDKTLLHLALLIHDVGKGYEEDHSIVGARIAEETADFLELDASSKDILSWLVLKHLAVNTIAFRHDLSDPQIVLSFAKEVGSIRRLELLIVHAVADLAAVGPDTLTSWKLNLIEDLYLRTRRYFETGNLPGEQDAKLDRIRDEIAKLLRDCDAEPVCSQLLTELPLSLLRRSSPEEIGQELVQVGKAFAAGQRSRCFGAYDSEAHVVRYTVVFRQGKQRIGAFARVTAALAASGLNILRAEIETVADVVWDEFWVSDPDHVGEPPESRVKKVCESVRHLLETPDAPLPPQRQTWAMTRNREPETVKLLPTKVELDNETLKRYTILSVFAYDQDGLLSRIAATFFQLRLELHFAKIDTHLDQIADVFYLSEIDGSQIRSEERQEELRQAILSVLEKP